MIVSPIHVIMEQPVLIASMLTPANAPKDTKEKIVKKVCLQPNYFIFHNLLIHYLNNLENSKLAYVDIDDCASNPCQNGGQCIDGVAKFTCQCAPGWMGDTCTESKYNHMNRHQIRFYVLHLLIR